MGSGGVTAGTIEGGGVTAGTMGGGGGPTPETDACAEDRGHCWAWKVVVVLVVVVIDRYLEVDDSTYFGTSIGHSSGYHGLSGAYRAPIGRLSGAYQTPIGRLASCHGQYYGTFCLTVLQLEGT